MPTLSVRDLTVSEADGFADVTVFLDKPSASTVTVAWTTTDGTAYDRSGFDFDYQAASGSLSFAPGETEKTVRISLRSTATVTNADIERNEWFFVKLSTPVGATLANDGTGRVTVIDNDTVVTRAQLYASDVIVDEGVGAARFVLTLGRDRGAASTQPVTVEVSTRDGSATAGSDFTALRTTVTFAPGETAKTVVVPITNDTLAEGHETFTLQLAHAQGADIARGEASATIAANDATPVVRPKISVASTYWSEGRPWLDVPVTLSAPSNQRITVRWQTVDDTATRIVSGAGGDYHAEPGLLTFEPGQTVQLIRLHADLGSLHIENEQAEREERFAIALTEPTNATLAHEGAGWITIVDNDEAVSTPLLHVRDLVVDESAGEASFVVTLGRLHGQGAQQPVTVQVGTADGTAQAGSDYAAVSRTLTFLPGESVQTVVVPLINDTLAERAETFFLRLSNPMGASIGTAQATATIGANDAPVAALPRASAQPLTVSEADRWADIVVTLSAPSSTQVAVTTTLRGVNATARDDFFFAPGAVVFEPGETTRVLRLDIGGAVASADGAERWERLELVLSSPVAATLSAGGVSSIDIVDNDTIDPNPHVTAHDALVDESSATAQFVVTLGRWSGSSTHAPLEMSYVTRDGSARSGEDYLPVQGTIVFLPGESAKTISVPLVDDGLTEGVETFELVLKGTALDGTPLELHAGAAISASDVARKALPALSAVPVIVTEAQPYADVWIVLDAPSHQSVSVRWELQSGTADQRDYGRGSGTLVFDPGVMARPVRVMIEQDNTVEGAETFKLLLSTPQGATLGNASATIAIVDAQLGGVPVQSGGLGNDRYEVFASSDLVIESVFGGLDTVVSSVDHTLPAQVEVLVLKAPAAAGTGNAESNFFVGHAGDNRFDGGDGIDTMVYRGQRADYTLAGGNGSFAVSGGDAGRDTLVSIERLRFADQLLVTDTSPGGRAFEVAALLNAGFNHVPSMADVSRWTAEFDTLARDFGGNEQIAQRMLDLYVPGGIPHDALVAHLWQSVVGTPITASDLATFVRLLNDGTYTQASLLVLAAEHQLNTADLVGLTGTPWALDPQWFEAIAG